MINNELRQRMKEKRKNLSESEVIEKSLKICEKLSVFEIIKNCKNVMVYYPVNNEVNINSFSDFCIKKNKGVIFPKVLPNNLDLKLYWVDDLKKLEKGFCGILEPTGSLCRAIKEIEIKNINLVIVPGIAFDKSCNRIGMGKGYYDRFLNKLASLNNNKNNQQFFSVGICYDFQLVDNLEVNSYDFPMDVVITESNVYFRKATIGGTINENKFD
jgi:5-formyltetrahydrofolate cyclo-ligase